MKTPAVKLPSGLFSITTLLQVITAVGLFIDAKIHWRLAEGYDTIKSSLVSQGDLFRIEAGLAIIAAVAVLVTRRALAGWLAVAVAGGGLVPLLVYRYYDIGAVAGLPAMYEPAWYPDKTNTAWAQAVATVTGLALVALAVRRSRKDAAVS